MIPRLGEAVRPAQKYKLRPGAYVILPRGDQVLLTRQAGNDEDIQLPGGGIDAGEPMLPALYREVIEETGWSIARPRKIGAFRRFVFMPEYDLWAEKLCHIFVAHPARKICEPTEADHSALWLSFDDAIEALGNDGDRMFLTQYARLGSGIV
ncbi:MAG: NUDIX hydrolase [Pseudomonadota bacterium]